GYLDCDGYLYFVDRHSNIIISGGSNIYPSDVEACLRFHPGVEDCVVLGVADSYLGQAVIAIIVGVAQAPDNLERLLRRHVRQYLSPSQQPLLYFMHNTLPLNAAGKIDVKLLRQQYNEMNLDPSARFSAFTMPDTAT
ncbi:MAG: hypothetical protein AAF404_16540, partial [Pseudomonadota bacterium]